jgi:hypothetical protein
MGPYPCPAINLKQLNPSIEGQIGCFGGNFSFEPLIDLPAGGGIVMPVPSSQIPFDSAWVNPFMNPFNRRALRRARSG